MNHQYQRRYFKGNNKSKRCLLPFLIHLKVLLKNSIIYHMPVQCSYIYIMLAYFIVGTRGKKRLQSLAPPPFFSKVKQLNRTITRFSCLHPLHSQFASDSTEIYVRKKLHPSPLEIILIQASILCASQFDIAFYCFKLA